MSLVYNFGLIAYPLYQSSKQILEGALFTEQQLPDAKRLFNFWILFALFKTLESIGASSLPLFSTFEALTLISLYSKEHSIIVCSFLPQAYSMYINVADKTCATIKDGIIAPSVSHVQKTSWFQSARNISFSFWGWMSSKTTKTE